MSTEILPREYGVVLVCNNCGAKAQTALCGRRRNREYQATQGWGRGSDPGTKPKNSPGRPSTKSHDLCPPCLALDRAATAERKKKRAAQVAARDAKRKERDAALKPVVKVA